MVAVSALFDIFSSGFRETKDTLMNFYVHYFSLPYLVVRLDHLKRPLFWKNTTFDFQENG